MDIQNRTNKNSDTLQKEKVKRKKRGSTREAFKNAIGAIPEDALRARERLSKYRPRMMDRASVRLNKTRFLKGMIENYGIITVACKVAGICRQSYYDYLENDPEFKQMVQDTIKDMEDANLDFSEAKLFSLINKEEPSAIYFHLKCKGKKRGYIEKQIIGYEKEEESPLSDEEKAFLADNLDKLRS